MNITIKNILTNLVGLTIFGFAGYLIYLLGKQVMESNWIYIIVNNYMYPLAVRYVFPFVVGLAIIIIVAIAFVIVWDILQGDSCLKN